jgi:hypothetical protein
MNKKDIVEIMSKKTAKLTLLSIIVVGMMVVLVPMLIDEAEARINAKATSLIGPFSNVEVKLFAGKFWTSPRQIAPNVVTWETWGGPPFGGGSESGRFLANVGSGGDRIAVDFTNPRLGGGPNTCNPGQPHFDFRVTCHISSGHYSSLTITVTPRAQENNEGYCEVLTKFGGIEQTGVIREKLRC